jgi:hypothetical protein
MLAIKITSKHIQFGILPFCFRYFEKEEETKTARTTSTARIPQNHRN